jgi:hypothetical protein
VVGPALPLSSTSTFTTPSKHPKGQILVGANERGKSFSLDKYLPLPSKQCLRTAVSRRPRRGTCPRFEQRRRGSSMQPLRLATVEAAGRTRSMVPHVGRIIELKWPGRRIWRTDDSDEQSEAIEMVATCGREPTTIQTSNDGAREIAAGFSLSGYFQLLLWIRR